MNNKTSWHIKPEKLEVKMQNIANGKIVVQKHIYSLFENTLQ